MSSRWWAAAHHTLESQSTFEQICRCAPSARDNYRSACRARSRREFVAKLGVAVDEADETVGWLEVMRDAKLASPATVARLLAEAEELRNILAKSYNTSKTNLERAEAERKRAKGGDAQALTKSPNRQIAKSPNR